MSEHKFGNFMLAGRISAHADRPTYASLRRSRAGHVHGAGTIVNGFGHLKSNVDGFSDHSGHYEKLPYHTRVRIIVLLAAISWLPVILFAWIMM